MGNKMKKNFLLLVIVIVLPVCSSSAIAQWTKKILPDPPYGHGALPGRVTCMTTDTADIYAGTLGGNIYLSKDNGSTWACIDSGLTTSDITSILVSNGVVYAGAYGNIANATYGMYGSGSGIYTSSNKGASWKKAGPSLADTNIYAFAKLDSTVFAATWGGGVYASTDKGSSWLQTNNGLSDMYVRTLGVMGTDVFAGTGPDEFGKSGGVFISSDYGQIWTQSNKGINNLFINSIISDSPNVYLGNSDGVYSSADGGYSWSLANSGLTTTYINTFVVIHPNLIVGTSGEGVFVSANNGNTWMPADTGLTDGYIYCFTVNGSKIFAGSSNGEIWSRPIKEIVTSVNSKWQAYIANNFSLSQNYPNPFNPATTIRYELSAKSDVSLKVYDALGRLVATLVDGARPVGVHTVVFDGTKMASGVYLYQLKIGNYISTRKMVLMK